MAGAVMGDTTGRALVLKFCGVVVEVFSLASLIRIRNAYVLRQRQGRKASRIGNERLSSHSIETVSDNLSGVVDIGWNNIRPACRRRDGRYFIRRDVVGSPPHSCKKTTCDAQC